MVQSVRRTRSRRMKFCVHGGLGEYPQQAAPEAEWLFGALLAYFSEITKATIEIVIDSM